MKCSKEIQKYYVKYISHFILIMFSKFEEVDRFCTLFLSGSSAWSIVTIGEIAYLCFPLSFLIFSVGTIPIKQLLILKGRDCPLINTFIDQLLNNQCLPIRHSIPHFGRGIIWEFYHSLQPYLHFST